MHCVGASWTYLLKKKKHHRPLLEDSCLPKTDFSRDKKPHLFLYQNYIRNHLGIGEGLVTGVFRIWGPLPRPRGGAKNPEDTGYKTFSYMKSSSNFLSISFWLSLPSFLLYVIIAIKARRRISWDTSMRYHGNGADLPRHKDDTDRPHGAMKKSKKKWWKRKTKRWNQKLYFSDFGRPSDRLYCTFRNPGETVRNSGRQVRDLKIHYEKLSWTLRILEDSPIATQAPFIIHKLKSAPSWAGK
jgi:hypothetical protein